ncbi:vacuolar ATP synthase subunit S1-domain-containing protein [Dipodascopsis tothii]|uniref:vacuolar ATP synthase subunit S1-domain-containing protein n=1 Tax=Dipodascopsis tothii TaxID=44089 RepID=UPI0034CF663E
MHLKRSSESVASADHFRDVVHRIVADHPVDRLVVVHQPGVHSSDFSGSTPAHATANLRQLFDKAELSYAVRHAHGALDVDALHKHCASKWGAETTEIDARTNAFSLPETAGPHVVRVNFPAPPTDSTRAAVLADHDAFLSSVMSVLGAYKYAVVYTSSAAGALGKREAPSQTTALPAATSGYVFVSGTAVPIGDLTNGSVFTRYQFFTPGMFMAIVASLLMVVILGVALQAISSIKISYDAFAKELGPGKRT